MSVSKAHPPPLSYIWLLNSLPSNLALACSWVSWSARCAALNPRAAPKTGKGNCTFGGRCAVISSGFAHEKVTFGCCCRFAGSLRCPDADCSLVPRLSSAYGGHALTGAGLTAEASMRAVRSVRLLLWRAARMSRRWSRILRPPPRRGSLTRALSQ